MLVAVVLQAQVERLQPQRRRPARLVQPLDLGAAHFDAVLREDPVAHLVVALAAGQADAGHVDIAVLLAAHRQLRSFDHQGMQPQLAREQRAPRDDVLHEGSTSASRRRGRAPAGRDRQPQSQPCQSALSEPIFTGKPTARDNSATKSSR
jgi:hypothetical protein